MHPRHETNIFDKYQAWWQRQETTCEVDDAEGSMDWFEAYVAHGKSMLETNAWLCETHAHGIDIDLGNNLDANGILDDVFAPPPNSVFRADAGES